jgi:UDP-glucose 4-epimerase
VRAFVTGAAGFIGSNLVDQLLAEGETVVGWDNFATGQEPFLATARTHADFTLVRGDNLDLPALTAAMAGCDFVFHLAASADVRFGLDFPRRDLEQNTIATHNVLEAMRANGISRIAFSSTGSIYGESAVIPTPEDAPMPVQTSLYGASKIAGEGMISAWCEGYGGEAYIFRFVSILGERYTHGHVYDFYRQLRSHPDHLRVLGDGRQRKSYLYVQDCVAALLHVVRARTASTAPHRTAIYNLGTDAWCEVTDSARWIAAAMGLSPRIEYTGGKRGWVGDSPFIYLATERIRATGWRPQLTIEQAVGRTVAWLRANEWVFQCRA